MRVDMRWWWWWEFVCRYTMCIHSYVGGGIDGRSVPETGSFTRDDLRWAIGVVRSRAVWITRRTTGAKFLALVPFLDLMPHHPDAGGEATLELDNSISVAVQRRAGVAGPWSIHTLRIRST